MSIYEKLINMRSKLPDDDPFRLKISRTSRYTISFFIFCALVSAAFQFWLALSKPALNIILIVAGLSVAVLICAFIFVNYLLSRHE